VRIVDIIMSKRDGRALSREEIGSFVSGVTDGTLPDYQASALLMAIVLRGMNADETAWLTDAMVHSGIRVNLSDVPGVKVDKHSTGGVGDKASLILAPLAAACGVPVPMMSGRGLGHTGGTLDKLEAIPGFRVNLSLDEMKNALARVGCAMIGQTADLAPADRRLYAVRDVTATVDSIPLITASILSKKLAAGLDALVIDVKVGSGAFATSLEAAIDLTESLLAVAEGAGLRTGALLTDMGPVLGHDVGNALEVREAIGVLAGHRRDDRLHAVTTALAGELLVRGGLARDLAAATAAVDAALSSGAAAERFARMITALGGPHDLVEHPERHLARAPIEQPVWPDFDGFVERIDARSLGLIVVELGGGRRRVEDAIDSAVGLAAVRGVGDAVDRERPLAIVHARSTAAAEAAAKQLREAVTVSAEPNAGSASPILRRMTR